MRLMPHTPHLAACGPPIRRSTTAPASIRKIAASARTTISRIRADDHRPRFVDDVRRCVPAQCPDVGRSKCQRALLPVASSQRKAEVCFVGNAEKTDDGIPATQPRIGDRQSMLESTRFLWRGEGQPRPICKQRAELRQS